MPFLRLSLIDSINFGWIYLSVSVVWDEWIELFRNFSKYFSEFSFQNLGGILRGSTPKQRCGLSYLLMNQGFPNNFLRIVLFVLTDCYRTSEPSRVMQFFKATYARFARIGGPTCGVPPSGTGHWWLFSLLLSCRLVVGRAVSCRERFVQAEGKLQRANRAEIYFSSEIFARFARFSPSFFSLLFPSFSLLSRCQLFKLIRYLYLSHEPSAWGPYLEKERRFYKYSLDCQRHNFWYWWWIRVM